MRRSVFRTIRKARTSSEAESMIGLLHRAGLHPADLTLAAPFALPGEHPTFPVQVPEEEADAAEKILNSAIDQAA